MEASKIYFLLVTNPWQGCVPCPSIKHEIFQDFYKAGSKYLISEKHVLSAVLLRKCLGRTLTHQCLPFLYNIKHEKVKNPAVISDRPMLHIQKTYKRC